MSDPGSSEGVRQPEESVVELLPLEITDLVPQRRNKNRFSLFHKEIFLIGISTDTLAQLHIKKGTLCTIQLYKKLQEAEDVHAIRQSALRYLGRRAHSTRELRQKLQRKEYSRDNIDLIVEEFTNKGWLDDLHFAEIFTREKSGLKGWGPNKIRNALFQKGIPPDQVEKSLEMVMNSLDLQQICVDLAMKKKSRFLREGNIQKRNQKIYRYLIGKGYPSQTITSVLPAILNKLDV